MNQSTLSVGADVHLKDIVLRAVDQRDGHEVIGPLSVTNNLPRIIALSWWGIPGIMTGISEPVRWALLDPPCCTVR